ELRDRGWPVPEDLPGRLTLHDARRDRDGGTVHLSYSDGLAAVSVFVQRGRLNERAMRGWQKTVRRGRTVFRGGNLRHWAVAAGDGYVYTVDRKSTRLNSSHVKISYAVFCLKK